MFWREGPPPHTPQKLDAAHPEHLEPPAPPGGGGCWGVRSAPDPHRIGDGLGRRDRRAAGEGAAPGLSTGSLLHLLFWGFPFHLVHQAAGDPAAL